MAISKTPMPILIHRIKTACYALSTIVLAGWVTNALNEDLMFKMVIRYFYPEQTEKYNHPFDNEFSFYIWSIPLLIGLVLMFSTSMLTVHHLKKRHLYQLQKAKTLSEVPNLILSPTIDNLAQIKQLYVNTRTFHFIVPDRSKDKLAQAANKLFTAENQVLYFYGMKDEDDLYLLELEFTKKVKWILRQKENNQNHNNSFVFDLTYSTPLFCSVALFCSLEEEMELIYAKDGMLKSYDVICKMGN